MSMIRHGSKALVLGLVAALALKVGAAEPSGQAVAFDIAPKTLNLALNEFAQQAGLQVVFVAEIGRDLSTPGLSGSYTPQVALSRLLAGTPFGYDFLNERTVTIRARGEAEKGASAVYGGGDGVRVAQGAAVEAGSLGSGQGSEEKQDAAENSEGAKLEEIVVTAQKRKENLQDVPISISVLSGAELDASSVKGVTDALRTVPAVAVSEFFQGGGTRLTVRGITASGPVFAGSDPIAYYIDGVPFGFARNAFNPDPGGYDLNRVEVLRGPQGTLYGAGGVGGVVRVLTNDPVFNEFDVKTRATVSSTEGSGDMNYRGDVAVNLPIVDDRLAARAVVGYTDMNGWIDAPNRDDVNDNRNANYRLKIRARPVDNLDVGLSVWRSENDLDTPNMGNSADKVTSLGDAPIPTEFTAYALNVAYDFPGFSLSSTTSYFDYAMESYLDFNLLAFGFDPTAAPNAPRNGLTTNIANKMLAEELLLTSTDGGLWDWTLGAFYRDRDEQIVQDIGVDLAIPLTRTKDNSKSYAIFGELRRWLIPDELQLTAGLRYFREDQNTVEPNFVRTTKPEATTPRLVLTWFPRKDLTFYASYAQGFRSGVAQQEVILNAAPDFVALKPDLLSNYELGAKGDLAGGRLSFEAAVYYVDWRDVQQQATVIVRTNPDVGGPAMFNAGSASGLGFDLALAVRPVDGLELGATYSRNDLTFDESIDFGTTHLYDKGDRLGASPETTASIYADYRFPFGGAGFQGVLSGSLNYVSPQNTVSLARGRAESDESRISQASFALEAPEHWTARLFVDNLANERPDLQPSGFFEEWNPRIRPRTVGLQFEFRY